MGIDHDEFEMYLESRLAKRKEDIDQEWLQQAKAEYAERKARDEEEAKSPFKTHED